MAAGTANSLRVRVGALVRARRVELGLSQGEVIARLGYKSRNSVSNVELGIEGLPSRRAHDWADLLNLDRDAFYRVVTGLDAVPSVPADLFRHDDLGELVAIFRTLGPGARRRLLDKARKYVERSTEKKVNG